MSTARRKPSSRRGSQLRVAAGGNRLRLCVVVLLLLTQAVAGQQATDEPISPIVPVGTSDAAKVALGEMLFSDTRLSNDGKTACVSCHHLDQGGDDGRIRSIAADGRMVKYNAPTVFNAALNFRFNWRGNFRTIEEQNEAVLLDPSLMNSSWEAVLRKLRSEPLYAGQFQAAYGSAPDRQTVLDALAAFQRSLVTPDSRFDRYLRGDRAALTTEEQHGYELFKDYGCVACHQGMNVGGNLFQKFGVFADPSKGAGEMSDDDRGRFTITGLDRDRRVFRVPSLRNVALTAPYFHDGRTASLEEAVRTMARSQLGRQIPDDDIHSIVGFLRTLTGEYRGRLLVEEGGRRP